MANLIAFICAFIALTVCVLNGVAPVTTLTRGVIAFLIGWVVASVFTTIFFRSGGKEHSADK